MSVITNKMNEKITGQRVAFAGCMASGKSYAAKFLQENWEEKTHMINSHMIENYTNIFQIQKVIMQDLGMESGYMIMVIQ